MNNIKLTTLDLDTLATVTGGQAKTWTPASKTQTVEESSRQFVGGAGEKRFGSGVVKCDDKGCAFKFD